MPMEEKRRLADEAIDCSGSIEETERQVSDVREAIGAAGGSRGRKHFLRFAAY